jgi:hypothetical protein
MLAELAWFSPNELLVPTKEGLLEKGGERVVLSLPNNLYHDVLSHLERRLLHWNFPHDEMEHTIPATLLTTLLCFLK